MKTGYAKLKGLPSNGVSQLHTYDLKYDRILHIGSPTPMCFLFLSSLCFVGAHTDRKINAQALKDTGRATARIAPAATRRVTCTGG